MGNSCRQLRLQLAVESQRCWLSYVHIMARGGTERFGTFEEMYSSFFYVYVRVHAVRVLRTHATVPAHLYSVLLGDMGGISSGAMRDRARSGLRSFGRTGSSRSILQRISKSTDGLHCPLQYQFQPSAPFWKNSPPFHSESWVH